MKKLPAFQFYPGDWLRDGVAGCSLAAQGLWLRLMSLAHDSERYGHLCQNGSPIPPEQLARHCGCSLVEFESLLAELESAGVPSRTRNGVIFSRRMVRDAEARKQAALRKQKERERGGHADVTPPSRDNHTSPSPSEKHSKSHSPSRARGKADPRTHHPAIEAVRAVLSRYPPMPLWDEIISTVGEKPDVERMKSCYSEWIKRGFKPINYAWLFDWYPNGIAPESRRPSGDRNAGGKGVFVE